MKIPGGELTFVLRFKTDAKGVFGGTLAVPEQGGNEIAMTDIQFSANKLNFRIPQVRGDLTATLANGVFTGTWSQGGQGLPVTIKKGEYAAPVYALKLSTEAFAALNGTWKGKLEMTSPQGQKATLSMVLRFNTSAAGQYVGFVDSPDQKASNIPVTEATLTGDKLVVKIASLQGEYTATLAGKTLTGEFKQGPMTTPLVLTK